VFLIKHVSSYLITRNKNTHVKSSVYYSCLIIHSHRLQRLFYPQKGVGVITKRDMNDPEFDLGVVKQSIRYFLE